MKVVLLRHGPPMKDGSDPALSESGRLFAAWAVRGLTKLLPDIAHISSSPLIRARETAELLRDALRSSVPLVLAPELDVHAPPAGIPLLLDPHSGTAGTVALVSHEPILSEFVEVWCSATVPFDRCGGCVIEWNGSEGIVLRGFSGRDLEAAGRTTG